MSIVTAMVIFAAGMITMAALRKGITVNLGFNGIGVKIE